MFRNCDRFGFGYRQQSLLPLIGLAVPAIISGGCIVLATTGAASHSQQSSGSVSNALPNIARVSGWHFATATARHSELQGTPTTENSSKAHLR